MAAPVGPAPGYRAESNPPAAAGRRCVVIGGPTASGKSALALALAEACDGVVINADSMQLYRELSVLTARPDDADLARAPHRLYGVLPAAERGSAAAWRRMAVAEIDAATAAGRLPIVVGGTGLYLRTLIDGIADVPEIPGEVRARARARRAELGPEAFHAELARLDPEAAARLSPGDTTRTLRAWEVVTATGRTLGAWQNSPTREGTEDVRFHSVVVLPPRDELYAACDARFLAMMERGAVAEVEALLALGLDPELPAMKAIGVREIGAWLAGELTRDEAVEAAQRETRRYAKRQVTWFRHQMPATPLTAPFAAQHSCHVVNAKLSYKIAQEIVRLVRETG